MSGSIAQGGTGMLGIRLMARRTFFLSFLPLRPFLSITIISNISTDSQGARRTEGRGRTDVCMDGWMGVRSFVRPFILRGEEDELKL